MMGGMSMELLDHVRVDYYSDGTLIPLFYKDSHGNTDIIDAVKRITKNTLNNEILYIVNSHGKKKKLLKKGDFWYLLQINDA